MDAVDFLQEVRAVRVTVGSSEPDCKEVLV
jgi:hypothetical protein